MIQMINFSLRFKKMSNFTKRDFFKTLSLVVWQSWSNALTPVGLEELLHHKFIARSVRQRVASKRVIKFSVKSINPYMGAQRELKTTEIFPLFAFRLKLWHLTVNGQPWRVSSAV